MKVEKKHLLDILASCEKILEYTKGVNKRAFLDNDLIQDALITRITQIGEAANRLSESFRATYASKIDWPRIIGMRHRLEKSRIIPPPLGGEYRRVAGVTN